MKNKIEDKDLKTELLGLIDAAIRKDDAIGNSRVRKVIDYHLVQARIAADTGVTDDQYEKGNW